MVNYLPAWRKCVFFSRILVSYERAEEYLQKITIGIQKQMKIWQSRRDVVSQDGASSNFNFLLPKTHRINELTIDTVQSTSMIWINNRFLLKKIEFFFLLCLDLCTAELLIEQILRIDPNSLQTRQNISHSASNIVGKFSSRSVIDLHVRSWNWKKFAFL